MKPIIKISAEMEAPAEAPAKPMQQGTPQSSTSTQQDGGVSFTPQQGHPQQQQQGKGKDPSEGYHDIDMLIAELGRIKQNPHAQEVAVKTEKKGNVRTFTVTVTTPDMLAGAQQAGMTGQASTERWVKVASGTMGQLRERFPEKFLKQMGIE